MSDLAMQLSGISRPRERSRLLDFIRRLSRARLALVSAGVLVLLVLIAIFADRIAPYDPTKQDLLNVLSGPSPAHLMGTDDLGRDILSRIIYGSRVSLQVGLMAICLALVVGVPVGLAAGYFGGWTDAIAMRMMDALLSFPSLVLALSMIAVLGPGLTNAMLAIAVVNVPQYARLARGQTLSTRARDFVDAARSIGCRAPRIMFRHILPNIIAAIIVQTSISIGFAILIEASLSFLGLGIQPPAPSWGSMVQVGYNYMAHQVGFALFPGMAIFVTVLSLNLFGDALRDAFDPRLRHR